MRIVLAAAMMLAVCGISLGQGFGLQIAETGEEHAPGLFRTTAGMTIGDDVVFTGGRLSYCITDGLLAFTDLGWVAVEGWKGGAGLQAGAFYSTPIDLPFDTGIRSAFYKTFVDKNLDIYGGTMMALASTNLDQEIKGLSVYGGLGVDVERVTITTTSGKVHKTLTDLALAAGMIMKFDQMFSVYLELSYVDDPFVGAGARFDF